MRKWTCDHCVDSTDYCISCIDNKVLRLDIIKEMECVDNSDKSKPMAKEDSLEECAYSVQIASVVRVMSKL